MSDNQAEITGGIFVHLAEIFDQKLITARRLSNQRPVSRSHDHSQPIRGQIFDQNSLKRGDCLDSGQQGCGVKSFILTIAIITGLVMSPRQSVTILNTRGRPAHSIEAFHLARNN